MVKNIQREAATIREGEPGYISYKEWNSYVNTNFPFTYNPTLYLDYSEVEQWCLENLSEDFILAPITFRFKNEFDLMAFKLRWC